MPTRAKFLAHGLAPVPTITLSNLAVEDQDCTICSETLSNPIRLPCTHIFDKACIEHWLKMPGKNSCPSCRRELFSMPFSEPANAPTDRPQLVFGAVRNAGLATDQPGDINLFSIPRPAASAMARAVPGAAQYLIFSSAPGQVQHEAGPAQIDAGVLSAHVVAMGNLLPALAAARGVPYDRREREDWQTLVDRLYVVLASKDGKKFDAMVMPQQLRQAMRLNALLLHHDVDPFGVLITDNGLTGELDTLLSYLTHVSFQYFANKEMARGQASRRAAAHGRGSEQHTGCVVM
ncbi:hypothetical protein LTR08_006709 [Meristemomyces frigidus]|nr:hypothetical protein LTR08_006709 [Meristemomyces frigidus]